MKVRPVLEVYITAANHHAHRAEVVGRPRHEVAGTRVLEVAQVHALERGEEVVAEAVLEIGRREAPMMMRRISERGRPAHHAPAGAGDGIRRTLSSVSELRRSSMAYLRSHGPANVSRFVTTTQAKPSRNERRCLAR